MYIGRRGKRGGEGGGGERNMARIVREGVDGDL